MHLPLFSLHERYLTLRIRKSRNSVHLKTKLIWSFLYSERFRSYQNYFESHKGFPSYQNYFESHYYHMIKNLSFKRKKKILAAYNETAIFYCVSKKMRTCAFWFTCSFSYIYYGQHLQIPFAEWDKNPWYKHKLTQKINRINTFILYDLCYLCYLISITNFISH